MDDKDNDDEFEKKFSNKRIDDIDNSIDQNRIRNKEDDALKLVETVFDNKTRLILYSMINKGYFTTLEGAISTGKEANVYFALTKTGAIAVKIYRIDSPSFKNMQIYVKGDHRFKRFRNSRSGFLEVWAKKEFKNLQRMASNGIPGPKPIYVERNILLLEFLGDGDAVLPRLKDVDPKVPEELYESIIRTMKKLYEECNLVHGDLSEYNILYDPKIDNFFIIDVSQSVLTDHPHADLFLIRDIQNVNRYFSQYGVEIKEITVLFKWITKRKLDELLLLEI